MVISFILLGTSLAINLVIFFINRTIFQEIAELKEENHDRIFDIHSLQQQDARLAGLPLELAEMRKEIREIIDRLAEVKNQLIESVSEDKATKESFRQQLEQHHHRLLRLEIK
jgi:septal ring factor EnvC (AmiA/AmiB activator)